MNTRRSLCAAVALIAVPMIGFGCINIMGTDVNGQRVPADACSYQLPSYGDPNQRDWTFDVLTQSERDAAAALRVGQFDRAYNLLVVLEDEEPGHYEVAANLGTALELLGRDDEAREWIAKGIERNVDNHFGTEWLHLRILDAKLALAQHPDWLATHSVIGSDFGPADAPTRAFTRPAGNQGKQINEAREVQASICYQMRERLPFTPRPNLLVGSLLFDAGNIAFHHDTLDNALKMYELAAEYSVPDPALLERRIAHARELLARLAPKNTTLRAH